jgi:hypothetical protein
MIRLMCVSVGEDESEQLKVENRGAWTKLAHLDSEVTRSPIKSEENASSSLWLYARSMEQQKLQKEQMKDSQLMAGEIAQHKLEQMEQRLKEKEREREDFERLKAEQEAHEKQAREERMREAEKMLAILRAEEREKLKRKDVVDLTQDIAFLNDVAAFGSASFFC